MGLREISGRTLFGASRRRLWRSPRDRGARPCSVTVTALTVRGERRLWTLVHRGASGLETAKS